MARPFLCLLANKDIVSAVSCLLPDQFLTTGLPWLGQLWALLLAVCPGLACVPPLLSPTAAPDVGRGIQERISGHRHPVVACILREMWGRVAVCGWPCLHWGNWGKNGEPEVCLWVTMSPGPLWAWHGLATAGRLELCSGSSTAAGDTRVCFSRKESCPCASCLWFGSRWCKLAAARGSHGQVPPCNPLVLSSGNLAPAAFMNLLYVCYKPILSGNS